MNFLHGIIGACKWLEIATQFSIQKWSLMSDVKVLLDHSLALYLLLFVDLSAIFRGCCDLCDRTTLLFMQPFATQDCLLAKNY